MKKILALVTALLFLSSCTYKETVREYGGGIKGGIESAEYAVFCNTVGLYVCTTIGAFKGYIDGKQDAREDIAASETQQLLHTSVQIAQEEQMIQQERTKEAEGIKTQTDKKNKSWWCGTLNPLC